MSVSAARKEEIRAQARQLVAQHQVAAPPVPVDRLARAMGVSLRYAPLADELSGMAFIKEGVSVIAVNALHHPHRQRFTIAHELAHHVLHADKLAVGIHVDKVILRRDVLAAKGIDDGEIEANTFASELLMPRELFSQIVGQSIDLNDEARLSAIARRFKVSVAALQYRLASID